MKLKWHLLVRNVKREKKKARQQGEDKYQGKEKTESHVHGRTVSLSSNVSHNNSKVVTELFEGVSEVECDLVKISTQRIPASSTKTTLRLCYYVKRKMIMVIHMLDYLLGHYS